MSLRRAVAAPFRQRGVETMTESELIVDLSLERKWFSADQAKRLVDIGTGEGLLERGDGQIGVTFDPAAVDIPEGFEPEEGVLRQRSTFERLLELIVDHGVEKQTAVADINRLQADLAVSIEAAAALYARRNGIDAADLADRARNELGEE
jgi:hypothetical protein